MGWRVPVLVNTSCQGCEVQPQATASFARGGKPDPTHLPSTFKELQPKQYPTHLYWDFPLLQAGPLNHKVLCSLKTTTGEK